MKEHDNKRFLEGLAVQTVQDCVDDLKAYNWLESMNDEFILAFTNHRELPKKSEE